MSVYAVILLPITLLMAVNESVGLKIGIQHFLPSFYLAHTLTASVYPLLHFKIRLEYPHCPPLPSLSPIHPHSLPAVHSLPLYPAQMFRLRLRFLALLLLGKDLTLLLTQLSLPMTGASRLLSVIALVKTLEHSTRRKPDSHLLSRPLLHPVWLWAPPPWPPCLLPPPQLLSSLLCYHSLFVAFFYFTPTLSHLLIG